MLVLIFPKSVLAISDPLTVSNNKFGIHIHDESDLENAKNLVNSSGGDWGYVTFVITQNEMDRDRWQKVFDQMRRMHIIPIVRIATSPDRDTWKKPELEEINNWVGFLNSLNWVTKNRYVVILNEPNLDNEWGGKINPSEYAKYLREFSVKLKEASSDFFVLPAGFAPEKNKFSFIKSMLVEVPDIFNYIDGWSSHPYPTESITSYNNELTLVGRNLPIFITETGWSGKNFSEDEISQKLVSAYKNTWNDPRIVAITPFILNYPTFPFAQFSWQKEDGTFYKFYEDVKNLEKVKGVPTQIEKGEIIAGIIQPVMLTGSDFVGAILAKNTGQSIWSNQNLLIGDSNGDLKLKGVYMNELEPMRLGLIYFKSAGVDGNGVYKNSLFLTNAKNEKISNETHIESFVISLKSVQIGDIFGKIKTLLGR